MIFRDTAGNILKEGDNVSFPMALGQALKGQIVKLEQGLGTGLNTGPKGEVYAAQPIVLVMIMVPVLASPTGLVNGLMKLAQAEEKEFIQ